MCEATSLATRRAVAPPASHIATSSATWSGTPATTVEPGDASTATQTASIPDSAMSEPTCSAGSRTDAIAPSSTSARIAARRQIAATPSASEIPPATTAAATSPIDWPTTAAGRTPHASQARASATWTANSGGWISAIPRSPRPSAITARTDCPDSAAISGSSSSIAEVKAGSASSSSRAIPGHCEPWPLKTKTGPGSPGASSTVPATAPSAAPSAASSRARAASCAGSRASSTPRLPACERRAPSVWATSASGVAAPSRSSQSASRSAARATPASDTAESGSRRSGPGTPPRVSGRGWRRGRAGASSSTMCALVPVTP